MEGVQGDLSFQCMEHSNGFYFADHIQFVAISSCFLLFAIINSVLKVANRCTEMTRAKINICILYAF
jgi:hypothetical protein